MKNNEGPIVGIFLGLITLSIVVTGVNVTSAYTKVTASRVGQCYMYNGGIKITTVLTYGARFIDSEGRTGYITNKGLSESSQMDCLGPLQ